MQEKSTIKKNILYFIDKQGITKYKFYQETGITRGVLDQNNGMSEENTTRFLAKYSNVNPEWLLTGKGSMLKEDKEPSYSQKEDIQHVNEDAPTYKKSSKTCEEIREEVCRLKQDKMSLMQEISYLKDDKILLMTEKIDLKEENITLKHKVKELEKNNNDLNTQLCVLKKNAQYNPSSIHEKS